jgi:hypothetical protein
MRFIEKKCLKIAIFAIFTLFSLSTAACDTMPQECLSRLEKPFYAEVEGRFDEQSLSADIFCDPTEHKTREIYSVLTLTLHQPTSLDGITVTLRSDGKATVRLNTCTEEMPLYASISRPFAELFESPKPDRVIKTEQGIVIETADNGSTLRYHFDNDGIIKRIEGEVDGHQVDLNVIKFEQK